MRHFRLAILGFVFTFCGLTGVQASEDVAVGIQGGILGAGLSGKMMLNDKLTGQVVLSSVGKFSSLMGRGLYTFKEQKEFDLYGVGELGTWFDGDGAYFSLGAGIGIETNWQNFIEDIFPLWWSAEIGVGFAAGYTYNPIRTGIGVHYRF